MKMDDYEREHYRHYAEFAETVKLILEKVIELSSIPRPQSIQHRAKSPKSLRDRLEERGKLGSDNIENERRDLAGVRIIFYTNTDVDRFLNAGLIFENFDIEREATRIHHPIAENKERRYRAIHYTVKLKEDRAQLPEYSRFNGMRCEVQVHTILNHAWSETSHDIAYKNKPREGFGNKAMEEINSRLTRIMDKYLLPAGYEFQRVQHDYERLQQGKELFDRDILNALEDAADNNERFELITSLKEHVIPNYDDVPAIFGDLVEPLLSAVKKAKDSPKKPIVTTFGELEGKSAADVACLVVEVFDMLRYVDIERTFDALCRIYLEQSDVQTRDQVQKAVEDLAKHDLRVWERYGPAVQSVLADAVERMSPIDQEAVRPLVVKVWDSVLNSEITGTTWRANSVTLASRSILVSPEIVKIRARAIAGLFRLFKTATSDVQRREVILALREATRPSSRGDYSNDLLKLTITDGIRIVDFFAGKADSLSYELRESMEHHYLFDYHRARELVEEETDGFGCRAVAKDLMEAIIKFRDRINADEQFGRYKTLVGFETVLPEQWDEEDRDFHKMEEFRTSEAERFVGEISADNEAKWFSFIERCAATKSNDGATFPIFRKFLTSLGRGSPEITKRLLASASADLLNFLPPLLDGLYQSDRTLWKQTVEGYLSAKTNLVALVMHWRSSKPLESAIIKAVLEAAIASDDEQSVEQGILYALENGPGNGVPPNSEFFSPALDYLTSKKNHRWVHWAWFTRSLPFLDALTTEEVKALLDAFLVVLKVEFRVERILCQIAAKHLALVWEFFGQRLRNLAGRDDDCRYEAFPYHFHGLEKQLSKDAALAVSIVRRWYVEDSNLFRFLGGRLFSTAFPNFGSEIADALGGLVTDGTSVDADFVLAIIENYHGEPAIHEVLKRIVAKYPNDEEKLTGVSISFDSTGVLSSEFGYVEAIRQKKGVMEPWLTDERPEVRAAPKSERLYVNLNMLKTTGRVARETRVRLSRPIGGVAVERRTAGPILCGRRPGAMPPATAANVQPHDSLAPGQRGLLWRISLYPPEPRGEVGLRSNPGKRGAAAILSPAKESSLCTRRGKNAGATHVPFCPSTPSSYRRTTPPPGDGGDGGMVWDASAGAVRASYWRTTVDEYGHTAWPRRQTARTATS
jgi:ppGpp synthetase/RelA/SpoT-type nucleotidyltranferase